ncbi:MAG: alkaline phosphatase D family protein [Phenylobacterium sp.]|uniref:alkaline phosphatase D family protein n=1 Tax=Phenylobacterium sp. TaxID=1871053 RepID=UPI00272795E5|nr:alkaline phosphatase D family protein [Phenylobacterium sp.]MDO8901194.1 alkaline phosphatase D family protein [Phenylobacterium sp.]
MSRLESRLHRRSLLSGLVAAPMVLRFGRAQASGAYLFPLGVASGDPAPDGFVLWTRLAADPLSPDGLGGLAEPISVQWDVATDDSFRSIVASGRAVAEVSTAHSLHIEVTGLRPGRPYWYRFFALGQASPVGQTLTTPAPNASPAALKIVAASCSNWESGYFSAYGHMADEAPDLSLFLGDYIYEYSRGPERAQDVVRPYGLEEATTLAGYRNRYALHRTDANLQRLHATAPCLAIWDDHEIHDDYSGVWSKTPGVSPADFLRRRAAGYQAFYEAMPIRRTRLDGRLETPIHRRVRYGQLAEFYLLDGRQHRSRQACSDGEGGGKGRIATDAVCFDRTDPSRTFLGFDQERWLYDGLARADARWTILGQNLVMAGLRFGDGGPETRYWTDTWDGFPAARDRLTQALDVLKPNNPVVLSGDYHSFWTADVKLDSRNPAGRTVATEFVGTSITSTGPSYEGLMSAMPNNPHIKFFDSRVRGYMSIDITPRLMTTRYQRISDVRDPSATLSTLNSWVVEDGRPGAQPA